MSIMTHSITSRYCQFFLPEKNVDVLLNNAVTDEVNFRSDSNPFESRSFKYLDLHFGFWPSSRQDLSCPAVKTIPKEHVSKPE